MIYKSSLSVVYPKLANGSLSNGTIFGKGERVTTRQTSNEDPPLLPVSSPEVSQSPYCTYGDFFARLSPGSGLLSFKG